MSGASISYSGSSRMAEWHSHVGTQHLLLGLLRERKGIAAAVLGSSGVTLEKARAETMHILSAAPVDD